MFLEKFMKKEPVEKSALPEATAAVEEKPAPVEIPEEDTSSVVEEFLSAIEEQKNLNVDEVLGIVLAKARRITGAEAGSIFIARPVADHAEELLACSTQNDRIEIEHKSFTVPINGASIAGYVAQEGKVLHIDDLYNLHPEAPYTFNRSFDDKHGYHSASMLAFPLQNFNKEVIGVVQLLNHISGVDADGEPQYAPFSTSHVKQMESVMTILGVMVERVDLLSEIQKLRHQGQ
jgi:GAF domain-containing protein